jgi:hypothetical protein
VALQLKQSTSKLAVPHLFVLTLHISRNQIALSTTFISLPSICPITIKLSVVVYDDILEAVEKQAPQVPLYLNVTA